MHKLFHATLLLVSLLAYSTISVVHAANEAQINNAITSATSYSNYRQLKKSFKVAVVGDSLGDGIWMGLYDAFRKDFRIKILKYSRVSTGFVSKAYFDWNSEIAQIIRDKKPDTLVMLFGANDVRPMRTAQGYHKLFSKSWVYHYRKRLVNFLSQVEASNIPAYWVGLPNMRARKMSESAAKLNEIMRQETKKVGIVFIETWNDFSDDKGDFYSYGPDLYGRIRRLRANDGIHFTRIGYRKLAYKVVRKLRQSLGQ